MWGSILLKIRCKFRVFKKEVMWKVFHVPYQMELFDREVIK